MNTNIVMAFGAMIAFVGLFLLIKGAATPGQTTLKLPGGIEISLNTTTSMLVLVAGVLVFLAPFSGMLKPSVIASGSDDHSPMAKPAIEPAESPKPATCRIRENGIESWKSITVEHADSGWVGGGTFHPSFCEQEIAKRRATLSADDGAITLIGQNEESRDDMPPFRVIKYHYTCEIQVQKEPNYFLKQSADCPAAK